MHESTVSRVTANKYIATPRGIFELKYFFTTAIAGTGGESHSAEAVRQPHPRPGRRRRPASDVLSDDAIVVSSATGRRGHRPPDRGQIPGSAAHPQLGAAQAGESRRAEL